MRTKAPLWDTAEIERRILYWKDDLIAIDKPYDWPTSGDNLADPDCVQFHLIAYLAQSGLPSPSPKYPAGMAWAIHQLDADTSGILLFTTQRKRVHHYHQILTADQTQKHYIALVHGSPAWEQMTCEIPIGMRGDGTRGPLKIEDGGQTAVTEFTVVERAPSHTQLAVRLHTGRTHQIRLHLAALGHPLLGEDWYAPQPHHGHWRQALHAHTITSASFPALPAALLAEDLQSKITSRK